MNKISKLLIIAFFLIVLVSVAITFYKYIVLEDINFYINEKAFNKSLFKK